MGKEVKNNSEATIEEPRKLTIEEVYQDLYKQYRKKSAQVSTLSTRVSTLSTRIFELQEENFILNNKMMALKKLDKETSKEIKAEMRRTEYVQNLLQQNKDLRARLKRLKTDNGNLIAKLIQYEKHSEKS